MKPFSAFFVDYLIITIGMSVIFSVLFAHTQDVCIAICTGFGVGLILPRILCRKTWSSMILVPAWKKWLSAIVAAAVGSQFGWVAAVI